jgi:pyridoxal phosphate enzyme (YggS family)
MRPAIEAVTAEDVQQGLARVREVVAGAARVSGRASDDVHLLAAVKYVDAATSALLVDAGIVDLAENRIAQLRERQDGGIVPAEARWHFIGRLQSREAAEIAARVGMIHTLCSDSAARRLAGAWGELEAPPSLLVQVNVDGDPAKDGLAVDDVEAFLSELPEPLRVDGFMAMPAFTEDPEQSRGAFASLRELRDRLAPKLAGRHELRWLSMGTSQDLAVAVEEGATHVRLGRILYARGE